MPLTVHAQHDSLSRCCQRWHALIPRHVVVQNAGNMGVLSAGIGWEFGRRKQWETQLLVGYIPKYHSSRGKPTITIKENFIPWAFDLKHGWTLRPLSTSLYLNTIFGHEFWKSQPDRYPKGYYKYMSTRYRLNIALGQQLTLAIPKRKHRSLIKSVTMFYELSSCDLYIRSKFQDGSVPLQDIVGLSLGAKLQY